MSIYKTGIWTEGFIKERVLPEGYTELEYIESTGTQYLDTGIQPCMNKIRCVCDMAPMNTNDSAFFGSRGTYYLFYHVGNNYFWPTSKCETIQGTLVVGNKYHVDWNKGVLEVSGADGVYEKGVRSNNTQDTINMYIFTFNPVDSRYTSAKLYNFKIYIENILVRNMIPALRNVDNVPGMYDTVTKTFFTNSGTGEFKYILKGVPSDYAIVDYIESTGTQWIDSGVGGIVEAKIKISSTQLTSNSSILWAENGASPWGCTGVRISSAVWQYGYGSAHTDVSTSAQINTEYVVEFTTDISNWYLKVNGAILGSGGKTDTTSSNNLYLFACNGAGTAKHFGKYKLYWCKLYQNGELIKNFIPCYRKSDNEPGLYDTVNNEFKTNSGTGAFTISSFKIETDNVKMFKNENIEANSFFEI